MQASQQNPSAFPPTPFYDSMMNSSFNPAQAEHKFREAQRIVNENCHYHEDVKIIMFFLAFYVYRSTLKSDSIESFNSVVSETVMEYKRYADARKYNI